MFQSHRDPIAIVGIGCRLPGGANDPESFWSLLAEGREAVGPIPADRFDASALNHPDSSRAGRIATTRGGFVDDVVSFDAGFFGLSPREALRVDPQQRMLLESTYRAFEDAGIPVEAFAGTATSVFVGIASHDYADLQSSPSERLLIGPHTNTGGALSIAANRISHWLDLRGPSMSIDTACSSSLIALHLACRSIWAGESTTAIVGGVNVILKPELTIGFSRGGFLSPEGRCRAFDAGASGYVRSEGAAVVLLKPLARALIDRDRIYALVRGTAANQDGRTPGLSLPSEQAQIALLRTAYADAGVRPESVAYVEAHGTGTKAGDPVEARAIATALGASRRGALLLGSVKTNLGHLEAGSGMAGFAKLALALERQLIPPSLHFERPNPAIPFDDLGLRVVTELTPWPAGARFAGINSFGFGGANAHIVLESPPKTPAVRTPPRDGNGHPYVLLVSAKTEGALAQQLERHQDRVRDGDCLSDLAATSRLRTSHHPVRVAVIGNDRESVLQALDAAKSRSAHADVIRGRAATDRPVAFVFSGQGPQWWGMGRQLLGADEIFADAVAHVDERFAKIAGWSIRDEMRRSEVESRIDATEFAQPLIFALQVGLFERLRALGLEPHAVVGHSVGEVAAAYASGTLSLDAAVRVIHQRSRIQQRATDAGRMLALALTEQEAGEAIAPWSPRIEIAAVNGPKAVSVAGDASAIAEAEALLTGRGVSCTRLHVRVPFHSRHMDPLRGPLLEALHGLESATAPGPAEMFSTVTGRRLDRVLDAHYWFDNVRKPVEFLSAIRTMIAAGIEDFVELGPHPIHSAGIRGALEEAGKSGNVLATLRRGADEVRSVTDAVAKLHVVGRRIDWSWLGEPRDARARAPSYPFEKERFWLESEEGRRIRAGSSRHPFLLRSLPRASKEVVASFQLAVDREHHPFLDDHRLQGPIVFPGAGEIEIVLAAARETFPGERIELRDVVFENMLFIPDDGEPPNAHVTIHDDGEVTIHSTGADGTLERHLRGRVARGEVGDPRPTPASEHLDHELDVKAVFDMGARAGFALGPTFRQVRRLRGAIAEDGMTDVASEIALHESLHFDLPRYLLHPVILDAGFQAGVAAGHMMARTMGAYVARAVGRVRFYRKPQGSLIKLRARVSPLGDAQRISSDIWVTDAADLLVAEVRGAVLQRLPGSTLDERQDMASLVHEERWVEETRADLEPNAGRWLVIHHASGLGQSTARRLADSGADVTALEDSSEPGVLADAVAAWAVRPGAVVYAAALDKVEPNAAACGLLSIAKTLAVRGLSTPIHVVTGGAVAAEGSSVPTWRYAMLWGLARVIQREHPPLAGVLIEVGDEPGAQDIESLVEELVRATPGEEIRLSRGARWSRRLERPRVNAAPRERRDAKAGSFVFCRPPTGLVDEFVAAPLARRQPRPGEVEVAVEVAALNFRDALAATRNFADEVLEGGYFGTAIGGECCGRIVNVGPESKLREGDRVAVIAPNCFASHVVVDERFACGVPESVSSEDAAGLLIPYLTAWLALVDLARARRGESVLIHSAAGGVGMAAVFVAKLLGLRIFATAGSHPKREYVRSLGVEHVMDSRGGLFADEIRNLSGGRGVDMVLSALAGRGIDEGLASLAPYGRFVEIGKRDLVENRRVGLNVFLANRSYVVLDINQMMIDDPARIVAALSSIRGHVESGGLPPLPTRSFPIGRIADAFKEILQAKHIGKIVLDVSGEIPTAARDGALCRSDGTYVISGGLSGFGLATARHLVTRGARHLVLFGRSGAIDDAARVEVEAMRKEGADVMVRSADVARREDVQKLFAEAALRMPPVRGIVHAAMVLDDDALVRIDSTRFNRVLSPKVDGALNLHHAALSHPIEFFVCYSSIAGILGNIGQASYAAANAALDAFAAFRRGLSLPALTIAWGPIADAGVVARNPTLAQALRRQGFEPITTREAMAVLDTALRADRASIVAFRYDSRATAGSAHVSQRLALLSPSGQSRSSDDAVTLKLLAKADRAAATKRVRELLRQQVARIAGLSAERVDPDASLTDFGIDSLMATQLSAVVQNQFGVRPSFTELMRGTSVSRLASSVVEALGAPVHASSDFDASDRAALHQSADGLVPTSSVGQFAGQRQQPLVGGDVGQP